MLVGRSVSIAFVLGESYVIQILRGKEREGEVKLVRINLVGFMIFLLDYRLLDQAAKLREIN